MPSKGNAPLPLEIVDSVLDYLDQPDQIRFISTRRAYREFFAPRVYTAVCTSSIPEKADSALLCAQRYGKHIQKVGFRSHTIVFGYRVGERSAEESPYLITDKTPFSEPVLPLSAKRLLAGECLTPKVQTLEVYFPTRNGPGKHASDLMQEEGPGMTIRREREFQWRAIMKEAWCALVSFPHPIRRLVAMDILPVSVSSIWMKTRFTEFVSDIEEFDFSVFECAGRNTLISTPGYYDLYQILDEHFLGAMRSLKCFSFGPYGVKTVDYLPWIFHRDWTPYHSRNLAYLEMRGCQVGYEIAYMCRGLCGLKTLILRDCWSATGGMDGTWAVFLKDLRDMIESRIKYFLVEYSYQVGLRRPTRGPFSVLSFPVTEISGKPTQQEFAQLLTDDRNRKVFSYKKFDRTTHTYDDDNDLILKAALQGDDQKAYDDLMLQIHGKEYQNAKDHNKPFTAKRP